MDRQEKLASLLGLLGLATAGRATVTVGGRPLLAINSDEKVLEVEADGVKEAGMRLGELVKLEDSVSVLEGSREAADALSRVGWKLTLSADGDRVLSMGSGVSRLTARISVNPLKLRKLQDALK